MSDGSTDGGPEGWYATRKGLAVWVDSPADSWRITLDESGCIVVTNGDVSRFEFKMSQAASKEFIELAYDRVTTEPCQCR